MTKLNKIDRKSTVLTPSSLACLSGIPSVNITLGCAHNCIYCYARGYSVFPGDKTVALYSNIPEKLEMELARKKKLPRYVYFSPSSDLFQPIPEVLEMSHRILEILLSRNIGVAFLTKGSIPDKTLELIKQHAGNIRSQIGLITVDETCRRLFEPDAATVTQRLQQMKDLVDAGVPTEARMIPIIPGVTDTDEALQDFFVSVSQTGIKTVAISALFLRPSIKRNMERHIDDELLRNSIFSRYSSGRMPVKSPHSSIIPLSIAIRQNMYRKVRTIAGESGINVSICGCMNPDIGGNCNITGTWEEPQKADMQGRFFL